MSRRGRASSCFTFWFQEHGPFRACQFPAPRPQRRLGALRRRHLHWRGPKGSEPLWEEAVREQSSAPEAWGLRISGLVVLLCGLAGVQRGLSQGLCLPREALEAPELPQRITREAPRVEASGAGRQAIDGQQLRAPVAPRWP